MIELRMLAIDDFERSVLDHLTEHSQERYWPRYYRSIDDILDVAEDERDSRALQLAQLLDGLEALELVVRVWCDEGDFGYRVTYNM